MAKPKAIAEIKDGAVYILQPGTPVYVKTADVCAMTGKSNQWIGQLTSQGTLNKTQTAYGSLYDLTDTVRAYCKTIESRNDKNKVDEVEYEKREAEAKLKKSKATIAALDALERTGKMHRSEDVAAMTADLIYTIRGALLALPGRLAVDMVGVTDAAEASDLIRREVFQIMEELSRYKYDSEKYKERVRERLSLEGNDGDLDEE
ncbi:MAG: hypothetical protein IJK23_09900 [Clostridia bacterium]|nr:hypothetical protein [Clostridia bacterium]